MARDDAVRFDAFTSLVTIGLVIAEFLAGEYFACFVLMVASAAITAAYLARTRGRGALLSVAGGTTAALVALASLATWSRADLRRSEGAATPRPTGTAATNADRTAFGPPVGSAPGTTADPSTAPPCERTRVTATLAQARVLWQVRICQPAASGQRFWLIDELLRQDGMSVYLARGELGDVAAGDTVSRAFRVEPSRAGVPHLVYIVGAPRTGAADAQLATNHAHVDDPGWDANRTSLPEGVSVASNKAVATPR